MRIHKIASHVAVILRVLVSLFLTGSFVPCLLGQVQTQGQWQTQGYQLPINPIHVALMHNGKILLVAGSGNNANNLGSGILKSAVLDPQSGAISVQQQGWDMFCEGMTVLPDGRVFVAGGTLAYSPFLGEKHSAIFDPVSGQFADVQPMHHGRWYPTTITLNDGRVLVFGGTSETDTSNNTIEFYTIGSGWSQEFTAPFTSPLYPRMHQLPNGAIFDSGPAPDSNIFDPSSQQWTLNVAHTNYGNIRIYGSSVLLPLTPANNYTPRIMILGGGDRATTTTASTEIIDLSLPGASWVSKAPMSLARIEMNAVILPNGKILALGGSSTDEDGTTASLKTDLYDPATDTFSPAGTAVFPRLYHSVALLLPDATVWVAGSNPPGNHFPGGFEPHVEVYSPTYLFDSTGGPAVRPKITSAPDKIGYGSPFTVQTDATDIQSVALVRAGSDTHAFDFDQRMIGLTFINTAGTLTITAPSNSNLAPPGYYMLFLLNQAGTPSIARFVQLSSNPTDQPPKAVITNPASDITIRLGDTVTFSGTASDPDGTVVSTQWIFPGAKPNDSNVLNPGPVTFNTAGDSVVTLTAVDDLGVNDPNPPTRTIHVSPNFGFTLTFVPQSGSETNNGVKASDTFKGTVIVTPQAGYTGTVNLTCSIPQCTITPASVTVGASAVNANLAVTTTMNDVGDHKLTITGTDSRDSFLSSSADVLYTVINPVTSYSLSATPGAVRVTAGQSANVTVTATVNASGSNPASILFSCSGLPALATCSFSPTTLTIGKGSGTTALSIATTATTISSATLSVPKGAAGSRSTYRPLYAFWTASFGILGLVGFRRTSQRGKLVRWGLLMLMLALLTFIFGCRGMSAGSTKTTSSSSHPGTPPGTYTVVVTGTAGQAQQTTNVTLNVN
ncbi:MAG TPA: galactose oxidase-like domain-containing protein [Terriglobales bacterium]|nr:galactose oxidase-like domain-containing protein [Terriglobales bacterium]